MTLRSCSRHSLRFLSAISPINRDSLFLNRFYYLVPVKLDAINLRSIGQAHGIADSFPKC